MTTPGLIMFGFFAAAWLIGCALVCWRSPKARARVSGPRLLVAMLIVSVLWIVVIPSTNLLTATSAMVFGNPFVLGGLLVALILALDFVTKATRTLSTAYRSADVQTGGAQ